MLKNCLKKYLKRNLKKYFSSSYLLYVPSDTLTLCYRLGPFSQNVAI